MEREIKIADLVGKPYCKGAAGPDAWGCSALAAEMVRRATGAEIPKNDIIHRAPLLGGGTTNGWKRISSPEPGSLVVMAYPVPGIFSHLGVVIAGDRFIHVIEEVGVLTERLSEPRWRIRVGGFYRWNGLRK